METPPFGPNAVLISPTRMAHRPNCGHNDEPRIRSGEHSGWGWVSEVSAEEWLRISADHPLRAAEGDTSLIAAKRCRDCPDR